MAQRHHLQCHPWSDESNAVFNAVLPVHSQTVALSNAAIFAAAITNLMFNLPRKNPVKPGPIIDYDLLLLVSGVLRLGSLSCTAHCTAQSTTQCTAQCTAQACDFSHKLSPLGEVHGSCSRRFGHDATHTTTLFFLF